MVTLQSADSALKSFYLNAITDALNMKTNPLLAKIQQTTANVVGKEVKKAVRTGMSGGIGAGTETGNLPSASSSDYAQLTIGLKNLYGTIEISDKAIRASANNEGAFVNLLNDEMEGLIKSASFQFGRMLFGPENILNNSFELCGEFNEVRMPSVSNFYEGMLVYVMDKNFRIKEEIGPRRVTKVNRPNFTINLSGEEIEPILTQGYIATTKDYDNDIIGLEGIFNADVLYGVDREYYGFMHPVNKANVGDIDETVIQKVIDELEENCGSTANLIICSWGVRRALMKYYKQQGIAMPTMEIEGGFKTISYNGIPVVADRFCSKGTMYILNTNDFKLCQLGDWQWLEGDDGKILHQVPGKPVYTATLVKYAELICERPGGQAKLTGITEA